jgi:hypothetical protein
VAHVDELAADEEVARAQRCEEQARLLTAVAEELKREAQRHRDEAADLRGAPSTEN